MPAYERSPITFEKPRILDRGTIRRELGDTACLLAAAIATETRIPLFTRDTDDNRLREEELRFFFEKLPETTLRSYAAATADRTAAVAVYRRTRHTVVTEQPKNYELAERDLHKAIRDLGVLSTFYEFSTLELPEQSIELAASTIVIEATQVYVPSHHTVYTIPTHPLAMRLCGVGSSTPDQPINLFEQPKIDITEYSPVFQRQPITRYGEPVYE